MQWKQTSKQRTGIEKETKKSFFGNHYPILLPKFI